MAGKTVIADGLTIVGSVKAEGLVKVNGQIEGEIYCTSLVVSRGAHIAGQVNAEHVVVDGSVQGPIQGGDVILKSHANVVGDIYHQSLAIERGAYFDGRSLQNHGANGTQPVRAAKGRSRQAESHEAEMTTAE
jgi:cytoskeletal protein CcmA (bactofilin family)